jgi:YfiH family protein
MPTLRALTVPSWADVPGLVHGFEQRAAGSEGETREAARRRATDALSPQRVLFLRQVHGTRVRAAPWEGSPEGDGALAREPGLLLAVETADCLPVLIVDRRRRAVAIAHAGWRGTAAGVAGVVVASLLESGSRASDLEAALGPSIGPCCYEVGQEVGEAFGAGGESFFRPGARGRLHLDLRAANSRQLREAGVPQAGIHLLDECTFCRPELYHSYRRDGAGAGRMISFVGFLRD